MTAEQIQSAIERAQNRIVILANHADCPQDGFDIDCTFRLELECAQALLDVYGKLQDAEKERDGFRHINGQLEDERDEARAELTEARKEIESVTEHARAMENSSDSYREMLDEARRQLEMMREAFEELQQITPTETPNAAL